MKAQLISLSFTVLCAAIGMLTVAWWNGVTSPATGRPSIKYFWKKNKEPFLYSIITVVLIAFILVFIPDVATLVHTVFGISITTPVTNGSGLLIGMLIYDNVRKKFKIKGEINLPKD